MALLHSHTYDGYDGVTPLPEEFYHWADPPVGTVSATVTSITLKLYRGSAATINMRCRFEKPDGSDGDFAYKDVVWTEGGEALVTFTFSDAPVRTSPFGRFTVYVSKTPGEPAGTIYSAYKDYVQAPFEREYGIINGAWVGNFPPSKPTNPTPSDVNVSADFSNLTLSWDDGGGADTYDIYLGPVGNLSLLSSAQAGTSLVVDPGDIPWGQTISWRVDATNDNGTTTGDTWSFSVVNVQQVRMGSTGNFLLAAATNGVYLSTDLGNNWTKKQPDGLDDTIWSKGICSGNGTYIIVVSD